MTIRFDNQVAIVTGAETSQFQRMALVVPARLPSR